VSVLVVGISHKTAPVALLERLALDSDGLGKLLADVSATDHVTEAVVIATCNRLEVYADVDRFHGSVESVSRLLVERSGATADALIPHLYVHYDDGAVAHLFQVVSGLDSMAVGEAQILGQAREALRAGQEHATAGPALNTLFQQALRVGKRAHAETDLDRAAPSLVAAGLAALSPVAGRRVVVLGAGSMAALTVATATRQGAAQVTVINRTEGNGARLAREHGVTSRPFSDLAAALEEADVIVTCTGAAGLLVDRDLLARAAAGRSMDVLDLALPHDVELTAGDLPGVTLVNLATLAELPVDGATERGVEAAGEIVAQEVTAFLAARRRSSVTPTVVALRSMATALVDAELARLDARLPDLPQATRDEIVQAVRRVADKLLHQPTVRVKELAGQEPAVSYAAALAELFSLDPDAVSAVTSATRTEGTS